MKSQTSSLFLSDTTAFNRVNAARFASEETFVDQLLPLITLSPSEKGRIKVQARQLIEGARIQKSGFNILDTFLHQFGLSTQEGIALMCVAEALLRIPDKNTVDHLIQDKVGEADWDRHIGKSESLFTNASTWALMLTGKVVNLDPETISRPGDVFKRIVNRLGEPVIRQAMRQAVKILGHQFVMGRTIEEALKNAQEPEQQGYLHSYDMLGEGARTATDATRYFQNYVTAIAAVGAAPQQGSVSARPGISVKLSAIHPRYEMAQKERVMTELVPRLRELALQAKAANINMIVDAEEADRWDINLEVIAAVFADPALKGWEGFGLAVQAYQKRALPTIEWLIQLARKTGRQLMIRLVKGAYWDTEIKRAQERGLPGYPVFTRKVSTDASYLACARRLLEARDAIYPMFATHNAYTVATVIELAGNNRQGFEFQRLKGMGEALHNQVIAKNGLNLPCRIYAPVGSHEDLLGYLVRRLLENGANTSFVNRLQDQSVPAEDLLVDPAEKLMYVQPKAHPKISLPADLFQPERKNSLGLDLSDPAATEPLLKKVAEFGNTGWMASPIISGHLPTGVTRPVQSPIDPQKTVGTVSEVTADHVSQALEAALSAAPLWNRTSVVDRAAGLDRAANLLEQHLPEFVALCVHEAGKTIPDAIAEVREAVDFCHYYAAQARKMLAEPLTLKGPTGETNQLSLHGRGVFVCISPWNFPLAIFMGQVTAALVAGNAVIAKPAAQTPLIAFRAVQLLHKAGIPTDVLHFLPGSGSLIGGRLVADDRIAGVAFTGSTETAQRINQSLAARKGPIVPFIAETGGQNAMIVDSTALAEQVVDDLISSAFRSAGQRCSAARVVFLQEEIADKVLTMLKGAMQELQVGNPALLSTDVGPVIDAAALKGLKEHAEKLNAQGRLLMTAPLPNQVQGHFIAPQVYQLNSLDELTHEVFGPILHVIRYPANGLDEVIAAINRTGYGLTMGIHTRIASKAKYIAERVHVGNIYVNRNMIGAVLGVQPFGGEGLSGTGPKAGGPYYLLRFSAERTLTINTTAAGGNTSLVMMGE